MDQKVLDGLRVKSKEEIVEQLTEIIHRHRRSFLRRNLRPCPENCTKAEVTKRGVQGCPGCGSGNREVCNDHAAFVCVATKEELGEEFRQDMRDPVVLRHDYRDVMTLLWVLGEFDGEQPQVDPVISHVEGRQAMKGKEDQDAS